MYKRQSDISSKEDDSRLEETGQQTQAKNSKEDEEFLNKLYLYHDVSPLNKVFTTLHRSTSVCILGTISECCLLYTSDAILQI